jgi:hypothetical protein
MLKILILEKNKSKFKRRSSPLDFISYKRIVLSSIENINSKNISNLEKKYSYYFNNFNSIILKRGSFYPSDFGFYPNIKNIKYFLDRGWALKEAEEFIKEKQSLTSKKNFISRYGEERGLKKYNDYIIKKSKTFSKNYAKGVHKKFFRPSEIDYWLKRGVNEEEIPQQMKKLFQLPSLKFHQEKRDKGEEWLTCRQIKYWISKGYNYEEASKSLQEIQNTRSLESLISKYGKEVGLKKFQDINDRWQKSLNNKSAEEKLKINLSKFKNNCRYSKSSFKFIEILLKELDSLKIYYGKTYYGKNEFFIYDNDKKKINFYDFCLPELKLIMEYNGILFHPNKEILSEQEWNNWKNPFNNECAEEKYSKDQYKINLAKSKGFHVIVIWETETLWESIHKIINYIKLNI